MRRQFGFASIAICAARPARERCALDRLVQRSPDQLTGGFHRLWRIGFGTFAGRPGLHTIVSAMRRRGDAERRALVSVCCGAAATPSSVPHPERHACLSVSSLGRERDLGAGPKRRPPRLRIRCRSDLGSSGRRPLAHLTAPTAPLVRPKAASLWAD